MLNLPNITLFDLIICLSDAVNLVSPEIANHNKQVAFIAYSLANALEYSPDKQIDIFLAGALHDIGALSDTERIQALKFESIGIDQHCINGAHLISDFKPLSHIAPVIKHHHTYWDNGQGIKKGTDIVPEASHIVHLADRIAVLLVTDTNILDCKEGIINQIKENKGNMFKSEHVDAFLQISNQEAFWLNAVSPAIYRVLRQIIRGRSFNLNVNEIDKLARLFAKVIDFRSKFTATHSSGVAACAEVLASQLGFSKAESDMMHIAGLLHDIGKLAIPQTILEKPGPLDDIEFNLMRTHTFHSYFLLDTLPDFNIINSWASFHHEKLNGNGYPFHHNAANLTLGSKIMAVADIFSALTEDRPYRAGMPLGKAMDILTNIAQRNEIDNSIVQVLNKHSDVINEYRINAQSDSSKDFQKVINS